MWGWGREDSPDNTGYKEQVTAKGIGAYCHGDLQETEEVISPVGEGSRGIYPLPLSWGSMGFSLRCRLGHYFSRMPDLPQTRASVLLWQVSVSRVAKVPRGATGHSRALIFSQSLIHFLIRHVPEASSVPGTELATGDSELNKIQSLPRRGSQVNEVRDSKTHNYIATQ